MSYTRIQFPNDLYRACRCLTREVNYGIYRFRPGEIRTVVYIKFGFERYTLYLLAHAGAKNESKELRIIVVAFCLN